MISDIPFQSIKRANDMFILKCSNLITNTNITLCILFNNTRQFLMMVAHSMGIYSLTFTRSVLLYSFESTSSSKQVDSAYVFSLITAVSVHLEYHTLIKV